MVITRTTRNRFAFTGTWVRIPSSPFFIPSLDADDLMEEMIATAKETSQELGKLDGLTRVSYGTTT